MVNLTVFKIKYFLYFGLFLMLIKVSFSLSSVFEYSDTLDKFLSLASAGILALYILIQKYSAKMLFIYGIVSFAALYSSLKVNNFELLITILVCLAIRKENFDDILNFIFKYEILFICINTAYAFLMNLVSGEPLKTSINGITRYHFGMGHPNRISIYIFNLIIIWVFLNFHRLKIKHVFSITLLGVVVYLFTKTKTNLVETIILVILLLLSISKNKTCQCIIKYISMYIVPIITVLTAVIVTLYTKGYSFILALDQLLTSRVRLGAYAYERFGFTLFGQKLSYKIEWNIDWNLNSFTFDNTYTYFLMNQGIIWLVILSILFFILAKKSDSRVNLMVIVWALYAITEVHGINAFLCFPILLIGLLLQKNTDKLSQ